MSTLSTINYAVGQDSMQDAFDKTNTAIGTLNQFAGGTGSQILKKGSGTDFDVTWSSGLNSSSTTPITFSTGWSDGGAGLSTTAILDVIGNVEIRFHLSITTGGTSSVGTLSSTYRPLSTRRFVIADYNGTDGASSIMIIEIASSGAVTILKQSDGTKPADRGSLQFSISYSTLV